MDIHHVSWLTSLGWRATGWAGGDRRECSRILGSSMSLSLVRLLVHLQARNAADWSQIHIRFVVRHSWNNFLSLLCPSLRRSGLSRLLCFERISISFILYWNLSRIGGVAVRVSGVSGVLLLHGCVFRLGVWLRSKTIAFWSWSFLGCVSVRL